MIVYIWNRITSEGFSMINWCYMSTQSSCWKQGRVWWGEWSGNPIIRWSGRNSGGKSCHRSRHENHTRSRRGTNWTGAHQWGLSNNPLWWLPAGWCLIWSFLSSDFQRTRGLPTAPANHQLILFQKSGSGKGKGDHLQNLQIAHFGISNMRLQNLN